VKLTPRFDAALVYASRLHASQRRKGTAIPYVAHLLAVTSLVLEDGGDEDEAIAALLHDAIEDHPRGGQTKAEIGRDFGPRVLRLVLATTDAETHPKPPWRERKERYLAHLTQAPPDELRVAVADKVHNARAILSDYRLVGEQLWERFTVGREETLWYYRSLAAAFRQGGSGPLGQELKRTVTDLERLVAANAGTSKTKERV
jgi:(p)ppGpp synthase/HD superfamily hydrolase